jgi:predicted AlkP superfamily pyrophosphatase or phosphodiesterase
MKKTLLVVIDALTARIIEPAMNAGRLPNLSALAEAGSARR